MPRRPLVFLVTMLFLLSGVIFSQIVFTLSELGRMSIGFLEALSTFLDDFVRIGMLADFPFEFIPLTAFGMFFFIAPWVFMWILELGYIIYARNVIKGEPAGYFSLLEGFNLFFKAILLRLVYTIILIGSFALFLIPGFIVMCAFSQVQYLLVDHPEKNIFWHFSESVRIMRGKKWEYFKLVFSFSPWIIVASLLPFITYAILLWLYPYSTFTFVSFYNDLTGQSPAPLEGDWQRPGMF